MSSSVTFDRRFSLRRTLLIFSLVLVILPAAALAVFATSYGYRSQVEDARDQISGLSELKEREIARWVEERKGDLDVLATETSLQESIESMHESSEGTPERAAAYSRVALRLSDFVQKKTAFIELYLMHPETSVVEVSTEAGREGESYFLSPHFRQGKERVTLQPPIYDVALRKPAMLIARPVRGPEGEAVAVLVGRANLADLDVLLQTGTGDTYLVSKERRYLAGGESEPVPDGPIGSQGIETALRGEQGVGRYENYRGQEVVGSYRWLPEIRAALLVERQWSQVVAAARTSVLGIVGATVLAMGFASGGALLLTRRIVNPLSDLTEAATEIAAGNLDRTAPVEREDEIGVLAQALNSMTARLREVIGELEQRVVERTRDLERRAAQMEAAARVARDAAAIRDVERLLDETVGLISEQFGFYHAGIFLVDDAREYAVLQAASSEGGRRMLDRGHRLRVGEVGIVGYVAASGEPRIALDVGEDAVFFDNPDLPETRSEMAVPLMVQREVVGVLDVQSTGAAAFEDDDVAILKTMADQVAVAIENARLLAESQRAVRELQIAQEEHVRASWKRMGHLPAFEYDRVDVRPVDFQSIPLVDQALDSGEVVAAKAPDNGRSTLAAPLRLRDQPIGVISVEDIDEAEAWSEDAIALVEEVSEQVAQALESARLFEEARTRAQQQSVLSDLGRALSAQLDVDEILVAAYRGASQLIDARNFYVGLYDPHREEISIRFNATSGERDREVMVLSVDEGLSGYIVRTGEPLLIRENLPERLSELDVELVGEPACSWLGVPLTVGGETLGVVAVQSYSSPGVYDEHDLELLTAVANQSAIAIQSARLYEEAVETAERLREVDRLKSQFLANMSHELRTPLNSIIGFSRVVLKGIDGPVTDRQREDLEAIHNSGQHLLGLINDILDVSKIEAGKMELDFEPVNLREVVKGVMSTAIALVKDKPIELQQSVPDDLPRITADERRVRQVLLNLVSNAAKFTQEGFIRVQARVVDDEVVLSVADSGPGIPDAQQDSIFEPFTQVDGSSTREHGGTGLGLTISHSFVELHGGRMWLESERGEGSTFYFALPIEGPPSEQEVADATASDQRLSVVEKSVDYEREKLILCVDDDTGVINLYRRYLHLRGYRVFGLADSSRALDVAKRLQPYAITLDVMMPQKDGWQVIRELKADPQTRDIPVIICSIISEEERGMSLGAADYLVKPIMEEDLLAALDRLNREPGNHEILVVDDQADDRALLRRIIESQEHFEVIEAAGGSEAIELVKDLHPHIIILDLMMPEVDGFAVLEAVKSNEVTRSIPVIAVTAKDLTPEDRQRLNHRVEALVKKGVLEQDELLEDVAAALHKLGHAS
jgi:signal transduction histidine kinase/DNA-binding response OmpR family regulator/HAMP domain-containing protein/putative methionine-R-sulfoxide reductase with GAF domain